MEQAFIGIKTISLSTRGAHKPCSIERAVAHNKREEFHPDERHDPARRNMNRTLAGQATAAGVMGFYNDVVADAGIDRSKLRKDHVQSLECMFSLEPGTQVDALAYFEWCTRWAESKFGSANLLSSDVHFDEHQPHCHVLFAPLRQGKWTGGNDLDGAKLNALRDDFFDQAFEHWGLLRPVEKLRGEVLRAGVAAVLDELRRTSDPMLSSPAWPCVLRFIASDPRSLMAHYGIRPMTPKQKHVPTAAQLHIKHSKPTAKDRDPKPLCFQRHAQPETVTLSKKTHGKTESDALYAFQKSSCKQGDETAAPSASKPPPPDRPVVADSSAEVSTLTAPNQHHREGTKETRERETEHQAGQWCEELGEFINEPPRPSRAARQAADEWVAASLTHLH